MERDDGTAQAQEAEDDEDPRGLHPFQPLMLDQQGGQQHGDPHHQSHSVCVFIMASCSADTLLRAEFLSCPRQGQD